MRDALTYRGPDAAGEYFDNFVGLGHRRLSIIDLSGGKQPFSTPDGRYTLVFNGEIYNYRELRQKLQNHYRFTTNSDTEVLLYHYLAHGPAGLGKLNGMFACAIWDRETRELFLARDRFGKKPLYYLVDDQRCIFASEPKSILLYLDKKPGLDRAALTQYFFYEYIPSPRTPWETIKKLEPGHWLIVTPTEIKTEQWWTLYPLPRDYAGQGSFDQLLDAAVQARLVADVPVGVFLSGGLDSSTITWYMRQHTKDLHSFSVSFTERSFDESSYAQQAARALKTIHHDIVCTPDSVQPLLDTILPRLDEPLADASLLPTTLVSQLAKEHVTVVLDGDGADELLYGYDTFAAYQLARLADHVPTLIRDGLTNLVNALPTQYTYFSLDFKLKSLLRGLPFPGLMRNQVWLGSFSPPELTTLLTPPWQTSLAGVATPIQQLAQTVCGLSPLEQLSLVYLQQYLHNDILMKLDRASMYASVEARTPFLDPTLVSFILQLPRHEKYRWGNGKRILKATMRARLPASIINRPKQGFGIPLGAWLRGPLRELMEKTLNPPALGAAGVLAPAAVQQLMSEHVSGKADHRKKLWTLMIFQWWWQQWAQ